MKGIVLAGGSGTRLFPVTNCISKQLLPVYDKPTIYYPISILMLAGIQEILIISTPRDIPMIESLFGNGSQFGLKISYKIQEKPQGIAQAYILAEDFLAGEPSVLILGDNLFYGHDVPQMLEESFKIQKGATIFGYRVQDPERYGVVEFDEDERVLSIEEKPKQPKTSWAVTGLYSYDGRATEFAKKLKPSPRGELEITDLNKCYLNEKTLHLKRFGRGVAWLDTGTHEALLKSSQFVETLEQRQGLKIACLEEIAVLKGFISKDDFKKIAEEAPASSYGVYLKNLSKELDAQ